MEISHVQHQNNSEIGFKGGTISQFSAEREKQPSAPFCLPPFNLCQLPQNLFWQLGSSKPDLGMWISSSNLCSSATSLVLVRV